jgi:hypothetical protein
MMRRIFSGSRSKNQELIPESRRLEDSRKKQRKGKESEVADVVHLGSPERNQISKRTEAEVKSDDDMEVYQYDLPKAELGFGDILREHKKGERMPGIAISKKSTQPREALMRELEQMQPDIERRPMKLPKKFVIPLINQEEKICLDQMFTKTNPKFPYILIRRMKFVLTPLSSFFDSFTDVNVMVLDTRVLNRPKRQTTKLNSNVDYRGSLSLDYCFPAKSLSKMFLYMHLEVQLMELGEEWATVMMTVEAEEMDFPITEEYQPVAVVAQLPPSGLSRYKFDPTHLDLTIREIHRRKLLQMYEDGDLADSTKPMVKKTGKVKYASTSVHETQSEVVVDEEGFTDWSAVKNSKPGRQEVDEISEEPSLAGDDEVDNRIEKLKRDAIRQDLILRGPQKLNKKVSEDSLMSFEKEASENAKKNQKMTRFQVDDVRSIDSS